MTLQKDLTIKETAEFFSTTPKNIYDWLATKKLEAYKVGDLTRIKIESILALREATPYESRNRLTK